ncbi:MAG: hypothetical protein A3F16_00535 [Deltaproteobacteria bacterium RIFCSPHIGHO2_12_FULL_43_9]|nr:MAG: hypothetical protein A3F16_00535 [Deltaproteobacteria bacterium RIFCSPHIGHO2_12_FULL_43_9]
MTPSSSYLDSSAWNELFRKMLKIRLAESRVAEIYPTDKIQSPVHLSLGQEAIAAGVCHALRPDDHIYGTYRGHGIFIAKGGDLKKAFAELYAKNTGCCRGKGGSMHYVAPEVGLMGCSAIVASTIPVAVGDAFAAKYLGLDRVTVAFFGDGAVGEGVFFESLNFAALKQVPVIFVLENNNYAVHSCVKERHKVTELYKFGEGLGIKGIRTDGFDVANVYANMREAVQTVRGGGSPMVLEFMTHRWAEHVGPGADHNEKYRDRALLNLAIERDSIQMAKNTMKRGLGFSDDDFLRIENELKAEIDEAVGFAEKSPIPDKKELYEGLFKERI